MKHGKLHFILSIITAVGQISMRSSTLLHHLLCTLVTRFSPDHNDHVILGCPCKFSTFKQLNWGFYTNDCSKGLPVFSLLSAFSLIQVSETNLYEPPSFFRNICTKTKECSMLHPHPSHLSTTTLLACFCCWPNIIIEPFYQDSCYTGGGAQG